jgi:FkbM family methyltransferase
MEPGPRDLTIINEVWYDRCYSFFTPEPDWVVVDVGAHKGAFTAWARYLAPECRLFAFEPAPTNYEFLLTNAESLPGPPVQCFNFAVGSVSRTVLIHTIRGMSAWSSLSLDRAMARGEVVGTTEIEQVPLERVVELAGGRVDLMKIDIEGSEYDLVLNGSQDAWSCVSRMIMEVDLVSTDGTFGYEDLRTRLEEYGFQIERIEERLLAGKRIPG